MAGKFLINQPFVLKYDLEIVRSVTCTDRHKHGECTGYGDNKVTLVRVKLNDVVIFVSAWRLRVRLWFCGQASLLLGLQRSLCFSRG